ncbi:MAG: prolyl oligopeptidase family serine peptidase, partial [Aeromicrobium sp.]
VTAAVSQAGVLDFALAIEDNLGGGAVASLMGWLPDTDELKDRYRDADPLANIPLTVPVRCIHGRDDSNVPPTQSDSYVSAATAAGADATVTVVDGDHFVVIDPASPAWSRTLTVLDQL